MNRESSGNAGQDEGGGGRGRGQKTDTVIAEEEMSREKKNARLVRLRPRLSSRRRFFRQNFD